MKVRIIFSLLVILSFCSYGQINLDSGLVAKYYFNGNIMDESGHGYNGTFVNGTAMLFTDRCGNPNSAYFFDGIDDYINIADSTDGFGEFNSPQLNYSVSIWFNSTQAHGIMFSNMSDNGMHFLGHTMGGYPDFEMGSCGYACNTSMFYPDYIGDGKWHFFAISIGFPQIKMFFDGHTDTATFNTPASGFWTSHYGIQIGTGYHAIYACYFGLIDDIRIYNRALNFSEMDSLYYECNTIGIIENSFDHSISIYPNPATTTLNIACPQNQNTNVTLFNLMGEQVMQRNFEGSKEAIDISALPSGMYIIKVSGGDWEVQRKVVKE